MNEYLKIGGCRKGGECRFSHDITDEQRGDPGLRETMQKKYDSLRTNSQPTDQSRKNQDILEKVLGEMDKLKSTIAMIQNCP